MLLVWTEVGFGVFLDGQNMSSTELANQTSDKALLVDISVVIFCYFLYLFVSINSTIWIWQPIGLITICSFRTPGSCASAPVAKRPDFRADCLGQVRGFVQLVWINWPQCCCVCNVALGKLLHFR